MLEYDKRSIDSAISIEEGSNIRPPGSIHHIPKIAILNFKKEVSIKAVNGEAIVIKASLAIKGRDKPLTVFPFNNWNVEIGKDIECLIYPIPRTALALPYDSKEMSTFTPIIHPSAIRSIKNMVNYTIDRMEVLEALVKELREEVSECKIKSIPMNND